MKRSINRWTTTLATVAMLGLPVVGFAQDPTPQQPQQQQPAPQPQPAQPAPQPAQPQPAQPQPQPQQPASPTATPQPAQSAQAVSPQEHLSQAKAAAESIATTSVPAKSRSQLAQLKKHLAALEKAGSTTTPSATPAPEAAAKSKSNWGTEVAAIDKIITEMLGSETATGTTATPGAAGTTGKAATAIALDDATRAKLMDIRTHITAYAAGMSGAATPKTDATPKADAPAPSPEPTAAATPAEQPTSTPSAAAPSPAATAPSPAAQSPAPTAAAAAPAAAAQPQIDADGARRSLVAARESLTQLTKLPAAGQLSGDARTQVGQLIANFNELISAQSNWRDSYAKVSANLTALLGPDSGDAAAAVAAPATATAAAATAPAATAGAVGTSGSTKVELDPTIREKLMELRKNLAEFEKASGGTEVK